MSGFGRLRCGVLCLIAVLGLLLPMRVSASGEPLSRVGGPSQDQSEVTATFPLTGVVTETVTLEVTVQTPSGVPLAGVRVALQLPDNYAQTDANGKVWLTGLLQGHPYTVIVTHSGYDTQTFTYTYALSKVDGKYPMDRLTVTLVPTEGGDTPGGDNPGGDNPGGGSGDDSGSGGGSGGNTGDSNGDNNGGSTGGNTGGNNGGSTGGNTGDNNGGNNGGSTGGNNGGHTGGYSGGYSGGNTGGSTGSDVGDGTGIELRPEDNSDTIEIPNPVIDESVQDNKDILLIFPGTGETGAKDEDTVLVLPSYTRHDRDVQDSGNVSVSRRDDSFLLTITVPEESTDKTTAGLTHNQISMVIDNEMDILVDFEEDPDRNFRIPADRLEHIASDDTDLSIEYDRRNGSVSFVISVQTEAHGIANSAVVSAEAFRLAKENGLELVCRIYDTDTGTGIWYEWVFTPEALKKLDAEDVDLYIRAAPAETDPILSLTKGSWCQYIIINHNGALPAEAVLRVKNLEQFPEDLKMALMSAGNGTLKPVLTDLLPDEYGWYSFDVDHCTSYALMEEPAAVVLEPAALEPVERSGFPWYWIALGGGLLLVLFLLLLHRRRKEAKYKSPHRSAHGSKVYDIDWEVISDDGRNQA